MDVNENFSKSQVKILGHQKIHGHRTRKLAKWVVCLFWVVRPKGLASHKAKGSSRAPSRTVVKTIGREGGRGSWAVLD
ncbi:hypothetical protein H5410_012933 [Solanum commersonii]|uniref:Uncharacterized protein n=1 Tax=Solanum commersonii TaxID=4109 RepID=A0A9J6ATV2_SOLCO|nr:hypothetical protein H5410_012933 [Solanum commersonii]